MIVTVALVTGVLTGQIPVGEALRAVLAALGA
jgi:hypothetical protein